MAAESEKNVGHFLVCFKSLKVMHENRGLEIIVLEHHFFNLECRGKHFRLEKAACNRKKSTNLSQTPKSLLHITDAVLHLLAVPRILLEVVHIPFPDITPLNINSWLQEELTHTKVALRSLERHKKMV